MQKLFFSLSSFLFFEHIVFDSIECVSVKKKLTLYRTFQKPEFVLRLANAKLEKENPDGESDNEKTD